MGSFKCEEHFAVMDSGNLTIDQLRPAGCTWGTLDCNFKNAQRFGYTHEEFCALQEQLERVEKGVSALKQLADETEKAKAEIDRKAAEAKTALSTTLTQSEAAFTTILSAANHRQYRVREEREQWAEQATVVWQKKFAALPTYSYLTQDLPAYYAGHTTTGTTALHPNMSIDRAMGSPDLLLRIYGQPTGETTVVDAGMHLLFNSPDEVTNWLNQHIDHISEMMANCPQRWTLQGTQPNDEVCRKQYQLSVAQQ